MDRRLLNSISYLKGVGEQRAKLFARLGVGTVFDLMSYFPRDYEDRTRIIQIKDAVRDESVCIEAIVASPPISRKIRSGLEIARIRAVDESGGITLVFFNQKYPVGMLKEGETYVFYGKIEENLGKLEMHNPVFDRVGASLKTGRIVPIYPLTAGLSMNQVFACIRQALAAYSEFLTDPLPDSVRIEHKLAFVRYAYENIHVPKDFEAINIAKRRLVFEELFLLSLGLMLLKKRRAKQAGITFEFLDPADFCRALPFTLTSAQKRAIDEAAADMGKDTPMNRLVQGDVGSGKTAVAAAIAYLAHKNGYQTALMAPTEILAEQHYKTLSPLFETLGIKVGRLTGSMTASEKRRVKEKLVNHEIDIVIGTHALLTEDVIFAALGLVITDEQHRFGVRQRSMLTAKGENPHLLVMSATPIPRTLALIMYGDLDVSIIDELPPGRKTVDTYAIDDGKRERAYRFIRDQITQGRQAYIVCPLVEEDDKSELASVERFAKTLAEKEFSGFSVAFVHGRMKGKEKDAVMRDFADGKVSVLVSTTVIEVGVDVSNASVMVVENAERFGLSQLHQLRGRVGRGEYKSYCILFSNARGGVSRERLGALCKTTDGFKISEEDLRLRGPGDFFGTRQHGMPTLKIASFSADIKTLKEAQTAAEALLSEDNELKLPEHAELLSRIRMLFREEEFGNIFN